MAYLQNPIMSDLPAPEAPKEPRTLSKSDFTSPRARRQLGLFFAGAGFLCISAVVTRRSLVRRYKASLPKFYQPSNKINYEVNGAMEAFEALNIATINVVSVAMLVSGGMLWAFDISTVEDLRGKVRREFFGGDEAGRDADRKNEEEIEEWFASVLARKEFKALRGAQEKDKEGEKGIGEQEVVKKAWEEERKS